MWFELNIFVLVLFWVLFWESQSLKLSENFRLRFMNHVVTFVADDEQSSTHTIARAQELRKTKQKYLWRIQRLIKM